MKEIGKRIKRRREILSMTQKELADKVGYNDKSTIAKIEIGVNDVPRTKVALFAKVLDTSVSYLMGLEDDSEVIREMVEDAERINILSEILRDAIMCDHPVQDLQWYDRATSLLVSFASTHKDMIAEFAKNAKR